MNSTSKRIEIFINGERRLACSAEINEESFETLQESLAEILEGLVRTLRAPKVEGFPEP